MKEIVSFLKKENIMSMENFILIASFIVMIAFLADWYRRF